MVRSLDVLCDLKSLPLEIHLQHSTVQLMARCPTHTHTCQHTIPAQLCAVCCVFDLRRSSSGKTAPSCLPRCPSRTALGSCCTASAAARQQPVRHSHSRCGTPRKTATTQQSGCRSCMLCGRRRLGMLQKQVGEISVCEECSVLGCCCRSVQLPASHQACGPDSVLLCLLRATDAGLIYLRRIKDLAAPDDEDQRPPCVDMRVRVRTACKGTTDNVRITPAAPHSH